MPNFQTICDWTSLICLIALAVCCFIAWCAAGGLWISSFCYTITLVVLCVFVGVAPFNWIGVVSKLFGFANTKIWRPAAIILLGGFFFPRFESFYWKVWYAVISGIASLLCVVVGVILLVIDLMACCGGSCGGSGSGSSSSGTKVTQSN